MTLPGERIRVLEEQPLSESSRKERRALLGFSALAFTITLCSLIPQKISAFGVEISGAQQSYLKWVLFGLIAYFLVAFLLYGLQDWLAWRGRIYEGTAQDMKEYHENDAPSMASSQVPVDQYAPRGKRWKVAWKQLPLLHPIKYSYRLYQIRGLFELFVPLLVGLLALWCVARLDLHSTTGLSPEKWPWF